MEHRKYMALLRNTIGAYRDQFFLLTTATAGGTLQYSSYLQFAHFTVFAAIEALANCCLCI